LRGRAIRSYAAPPTTKRAAAYRSYPLRTPRFQKKTTFLSFLNKSILSKPQMLWVSGIFRSRISRIRKNSKQKGSDKPQSVRAFRFFSNSTSQIARQSNNNNNAVNYIFRKRHIPEFLT